MTTLTMRMIKGDFLVTGRRLASRAEQRATRVNPTHCRARLGVFPSSRLRTRVGNFKSATGLGKGKEPPAKGGGRPTFQAVITAPNDNNALASETRVCRKPTVTTQLPQE
jgi:hypothetical protein